MKNYEIIEHTADICIKVRGKDLEDLFKKAGLAIFEISCEKKNTKNKEHLKLIITQRADNLDELFINWLNELLSLSQAKGLIFEDIKIDRLNEREIEATAIGSEMNNYKVNTEIKAATYHELKLEHVKTGWQAQIIFDV